jgi:hypothetical protein
MIDDLLYLGISAAIQIQLPFSKFVWFVSGWEPDPTMAVVSISDSQEKHWKRDKIPVS